MLYRIYAIDVRRRRKTTNHNLEVELGRCTATPRAKRHCRLCQTGQVETEKHLLTECPAYELMRFQFVNSTDIPESVVDSNQLFLYLMSNTLGHTECNTLGQYVIFLGQVG